MADDAVPDRELRPVGRYEWEQILRRARLEGVVAGSGRVGANGRATRGGMTGMTFKAIAFGWSSYADDKGQDIWPGDATVAVALETTIKNVATVRRALIELGLLQFVRGRRGRRGDEYRLTMPSDLLDRVEVLTPGQHALAAGRLRDTARGKHRGGSGGPPTPPPLGGPVDHPEPVDNSDAGGPVDHPKSSRAEAPGGSGGPAGIPSGGSGGPAPGGSGGPAYRPRTVPRTTTDHADTDLRTAVTVSRASPADQDPIPDEEGPPGRCPSHGLAGGYRKDGLHRCPLCRVEARRAPATHPPPLRLIAGGAA